MYNNESVFPLIIASRVDKRMEQIRLCLLLTGKDSYRRKKRYMVGKLKLVVKFLT